MNRIWIAVPEGLVSPASELAAALGQSEGDRNTFAPGHAIMAADGAGGMYRVTSGQVSSEWLWRALEPLVEPPWGADMALAAQAQAALVVWSGEGEPPLAQPESITVIVGPSGLDAVAMMGLSLVEGDALGG